MNNRTNRTPKKEPLTWQQKFLKELATGGNVSFAAKVAGRGRTCVYQHRDSDPAFAAAWEEALDTAADELEAECRRRAIEKSDVLLIFLLKALRPHKFLDNPPPLPEKHGGRDIEKDFVDFLDSLKTTDSNLPPADRPKDLH